MSFDRIVQQVLKHVARYKMGVPEVLERLGVFNGRGYQVTKKALRRMCCESKLIEEAPLFGSRKYYFLTPHGASVVGSDPGRTGALSEECKIVAFSTLSFCCRTDRQREKLTLNEFQKYFPDLYEPTLPMQYYVDTSSANPRLGFLRIDRGGRGRWDRVAAKCRHDIDRHLDFPAFRDFIGEGHFEVTVVTALEQKAERLRTCFEDMNRVTGLGINVVAVPELLNLLAPPPTSHATNENSFGPTSRVQLRSRPRSTEKQRDEHAKS